MEEVIRITSMLHANAKYIVMTSQLVQTICHVAMHLTMHSNADVYMGPTNEQRSLLHSLQHTIHNYHHYCYHRQVLLLFHLSNLLLIIAIATVDKLTRMPLQNHTTMFPTPKKVHLLQNCNINRGV